MRNLLIQNLSEDLFIQLQENAALSGITPENQAAAVLKTHLTQPRPMDTDEILTIADTVRIKHAHRQKSDSVLLIREKRNVS